MLGLGANITGGSPVGASGVAAPSLYFYDADMANDSFDTTGSTIETLSEYEGVSDVLKITGNITSLFLAVESCDTLISGRKYKFEIDYYAPSSLSISSIDVFEGQQTFSDITTSITNDQWATAISSDILFDNGNVSDLFIRFNGSVGSVVYVSDIRITDVTVFPTLPSPPPGGFYNLALDQQVGISGVQDLAAVYSVNLLVSFYDGDAIRVRRASDNTEQDIGFVNGELDTTALTSFCAGTDGFVVTWYNQDGSGNDFGQGTSAAQPKIYDAATGVELDNAVEALTFDGVDDVLSSSSTISAASDYTIYIVENRPQNVAYSLDSRTGRLILGNSQGAYYDGAFQGSALTQGAQALNGYYLLSGGAYISENGSITQSGLSYTQRSISNDTSFFAHNDGTSRFVVGKLQAVIIYNADKSANRVAIETAINGYFNIY